MKKISILVLVMIVSIFCWFNKAEKEKINLEQNRYSCYDELLQNFGLFKFQYDNCLLTPKDNFYLFSICDEVGINIFKEKIFLKTAFADKNYINKCINKK